MKSKKHCYYPIFRLLIVLFFIGQKSFAQDTITQARPVPFFSITDSNQLSKRDLVSRIENAFLTLSKVQSQITVANLNNDSGTIKNAATVLGLIDTSLQLKANTNPRDLQLYLNLLEDAEEKIKNSQAVLQAKAQSCESARNNINAIARDPLINSITSSGDSMTLLRLQPLKDKWFQTDSMITKALASVDEQSIALSFIMLRNESLKRLVNKKFLKSSIEAFKKESKDSTGNANLTAKMLTDAAKNNGKILAYYIGKNLFNLFWLPLILVLLMYGWLRKKFKTVSAWENGRYLENNELKYINRYRFLPALLVVVSLIPLVDIYAPSAYTVLIQLLSIILFYCLLTKAIKQQYRWHYMLLCLVFLAVITANSLSQGLAQKMILGACNIIAVILSLKSFVDFRNSPVKKTYISYITVAYGLLNIGAFLLTLTGRITLAQNISFAVTAGLIQLLCLLMAKEILLEIVKLQIAQKRIKLNVNPHFNSEKVTRNLQVPLNMLIALLCVMVFAANINIYTFFKAILNYIFALPLHLGNANIKIGSILLFLIIVLIAHFLKKHIGYVFGDTGNEEDEDDANFQRSGLVITRLMIICLGYILAIAASGLPVDKITIILGALGVGVGMGFQNIVNNFVSGIILLFERPLKIGDNVSVNGKSGKVKEMGIRTSTLLTEDGAEVIIPNGTILSQDITNWSFSNNKRRIELMYSLGTDKNNTVVAEQMIDVITGSGWAILYPKPSVLLENITDKELKLRVHFWCRDANEIDTVKSEVKYQLYVYFRENNIELKA